MASRWECDPDKQRTGGITGFSQTHSSMLDAMPVLDAMMTLSGLLFAAALLLAVPEDVSGEDEKGLHVSEVTFVIESVMLGTTSMVVGIGVVIEAPVGGTILLAGGSLLSVGMPVAKWVERQEKSEWP